MEFNELLEKRRSVRKYKADTTVDRETIEEILKAAQQAPTWKIHKQVDIMLLQMKKS